MIKSACILFFGGLLLFASCSKDTVNDPINLTGIGINRVPGLDTSYVIVKVNGQWLTILDDYGSAQMERNSDSVFFSNIDNGQDTTNHRWFRVYFPKANKLGSYQVGKGISSGYLTMILHSDNSGNMAIVNKYHYTANKDRGHATFSIDKIVPNSNGNGMRYASGTFSGVVYNAFGDSLVLTEGVYVDKRTR